MSPLPPPKPNETKEQYIPRCISFQTKHEKTKPEDKRRSGDQVAAMCYERYRQRGKSVEEIAKELRERILKLEGGNCNQCP